jgi:hypothetical protein
MENISKVYVPLSQEERDRIRKQLANYKGPVTKLVLPKEVSDYLIEALAVLKK